MRVVSSAEKKLSESKPVLDATSKRARLAFSGRCPWALEKTLCRNAYLWYLTGKAPGAVLPQLMRLSFPRGRDTGISATEAMQLMSGCGSKLRWDSRHCGLTR